MYVLISTQADHVGRLAYLGHGPTEAHARRAAYEWVHKGVNPDDQELAGGRVVEGSRCTPRLREALAAARMGGDEVNTFNWAIGSLYINVAGDLDAHYFSRAEWSAATGLGVQHAPMSEAPGPDWDDSEAYEYDR